MLAVEHICKSFGDHRVLNDVSFDIADAEVVGLSGHNGAGKTTLLRIVNLLLEPDAGRLLFSGHAMTRADLRYVGYLPEERGLYRNIRAGRQIVYLAMLKGLSYKAADAAARQWFHRLDIEAWWNIPVARLSKGMQQRLQLVAAMVHAPQLLILDEPFSGFDADASMMLRDLVRSLADNGTSVLISSHNLSALDELCNKTIWL